MATGSKRHLHVLIDSELYIKLITIAPSITNQSKYKGAISQVVEDALRLYFSQRAPQGGESPPRSTHIHTKRRKSVYELFQEVLNNIKKQYGYYESEPLCEIKEKDLVKAIQLSIGIDPRTVDKYIGVFQNHNLIEYDRGSSPNMVFRVLIYPECKKSVHDYA